MRRPLPELLLAGLLLTGSALAADKAAPLPAPLEVRYTLHYRGMTVGESDLRLTLDGPRYHYRQHTRPLGMAKLFTKAEWFEEGEFEISNTLLRPLRYLKYRTGTDKPRRREVTFDWPATRLRFDDGRTRPLGERTLDGGSLLFALMLDPPRPGEARESLVTNAKKVFRYRYEAVGTETLDTALGKIETLHIRRLPLEDEACRQDKKISCADDDELELWLATGHRNLPVRIVSTDEGRRSESRIASYQTLKN
jgi:hypothetical protein